MMALSTNRLSLARAVLMAATLLLSACHHGPLYHNSHNNTLAAAPEEANSWDASSHNDTLVECQLIRDPSPQSHFMMLNLCWNEEQAQRERLKKSVEEK